MDELKFRLACDASSSSAAFGSYRLPESTVRKSEARYYILLYIKTILYSMSPEFIMIRLVCNRTLTRGSALTVLL